ncbi:MAG: hypothetical protein RO469_04225 [Thermincola sp.]|nr:hypothetical protein [Thermincola sp.]
MINSLLKDRFTRGFIAGLLSGVIALGFNLFLYYIIHISTLVWGDFIAGFIFRRKVASSWEYVLAMVIGVLFTAVLGTLFSLIIPNIKSKYLWFKGLIYGLFLWFAIFSITIMFRIPSLTVIPSKTALSSLISASIWGILLGVFLNLLNPRTETSSIS